MNLNPWREVEHIEHTTGSRGGEVWLLTLSCGHHKAVPIPKSRPEFILVMSFKERTRRIPKKTAPYKVRCIICRIISESEVNKQYD